VLSGPLFIALLLAGTAGGFYVLIKTKNIDLTINNPLLVPPEDEADEARTQSQNS